MCNFSSPPNLFRAPVVQWLNSSESVVSNTTSLQFNLLKTSNAGKYSCQVNISISVLDIALTGSNSTILNVQGKKTYLHNT